MRWRGQGCDIFCFGGLPINVSRGFANAEEMAAATEKEIGIPVITSVSSQRDALAALGSQKIGIVQPYDDSHGLSSQVDEQHMNYIHEMGLEPMGYVCLNTTFIKLGEVDESMCWKTPAAFAGNIRSWIRSTCSVRITR